MKGRLSLLFLLGCLVASGGAAIVRASVRHVREGSVMLGTLVPRQFADWRQVSTDLDVADPAIAGDGGHDLYDQIITRTYRRSDGATVVLTLAYRREQTEESKIHRPELCYFAQGFALADPALVPIWLTGGRLPATSFVATRADHVETVAYMIRIGDRLSRSAWQSRWRLFVLSLKGIVPDGVLIRASIVAPVLPDDRRIAANRRILAKFLQALAVAPVAGDRWVLSGGPAAYSRLD